jgi:hypothetical protein
MTNGGKENLAQLLESSPKGPAGAQTLAHLCNLTNPHPH